MKILLIKNISYLLLSCFLLFALAFSLSSGLFFEFVEYGLEKITPKVEIYIRAQVGRLENYPDAKQYLLLPGGKYLEFYTKGLSLGMFFTIIANALFNSLFQPIFFCVFTPQVILNYILFPFFLYGAIKHFKKIPIMLLVFLAVSIYIGMHSSLVETLIRHRMSCELIYLLIGLAGFTDWITKNLS